jgi:hypothetical protein
MRRAFSSGMTARKHPESNATPKDQTTSPGAPRGRSVAERIAREELERFFAQLGFEPGEEEETGIEGWTITPLDRRP